MRPMPQRSPRSKATPAMTINHPPRQPIHRRLRSLPVALLLALLIAGTGHAQPVIRLARLSEFPDQLVGSSILQVVYRRLNITVEFVDLPAKRALALSSAGVIDGEVQKIAAVVRDYPTLVQLSSPINYIEPSVFATRLRFTANGWESIEKYRIGIVRGVGSSEAGTKGMPHVEAATNLENLVRMLDADRIDVLVTDLFSGRITVKRMGLASRIYALPPPLERIPVFHYLHERHSELAQRVEIVLREMTASGELAQLRQMFMRQLLETS